MRASKRVAALLLSAGLAAGGLFAGVAAGAQTGDEYIPVTTGGQPFDPGGPGEPAEVATDSSLPFTGGDLAGLLAVGGAVLGTGLVVRTIGKRRSEPEIA